MEGGRSECVGDGVFEGLGEMARGRGRDKGGEEGFIEFACGEPTLGPACGRSSCLDFPLVVDATGWPVKLWSEHGIPKRGRRFSKRRDSRRKPRAPAEKSNYALGTSGHLEAGCCFEYTCYLALGPSKKKYLAYLAFFFCDRCLL